MIDDDFLALCEKFGITIDTGGQYSVKCQIAQLINLMSFLVKNKHETLIEKVQKSQSQTELTALWNDGYNLWLYIKREILIREGQLNQERDRIRDEKLQAEKEAQFLNYLRTGK